MDRRTILAIALIMVVAILPSILFPNKKTADGRMGRTGGQWCGHAHGILVRLHRRSRPHCRRHPPIRLSAHPPNATPSLSAPWWSSRHCIVTASRLAARDWSRRPQVLSIICAG